MNRRFQLVRGIVASVAIAALLIGTGCSGLRSATETYSSGAADSAGSMSAVEGVAPITSDKDAAQPAPTEAGSVPAETVSAERMIVSNSSMSLQVDDVDKSLDCGARPRRLERFADHQPLRAGRRRRRDAARRGSRTVDSSRALRR